MKTKLSILGALLSCAYLPLTVYMSWLLYQHIHATDLMWFLFWMNVPLMIVVTIIGHIIKVLTTDEKES